MIGLHEQPYTRVDHVYFCIYIAIRNNMIIIITINANVWVYIYLLPIAVGLLRAVLVSVTALYSGVPSSIPGGISGFSDNFSLNEAFV